MTIKSLHCGYFDEVFNPQKLIGIAQEHLGEHRDRFDLLVGSGLSGTLAVGMIALALDKRFVIVRKGTENSHSLNKFEGVIGVGDRWLFVDDFISLGTTRNRCAGALPADMNLKYAGTFTYHDGYRRVTWAAEGETCPNRGDY